MIDPEIKSMAGILNGIEHGADSINPESAK